MKFLIRGGSIAAGKGVHQGYVDMLKHDPLFNDFEIILKAKEGDTTFDGIGDYRDDIGKHMPDILFIHFGIDDIYLPVYRSEFKENLVQIVRLARSEFNPQIILMTSHPFEDEYEMNSANIYYRTIREVAIDLECELIPLHLFWTNYLYVNDLKHNDFIQKDNRLPNENGHSIISKAIIAKMRRFLSDNKKMD